MVESRGAHNVQISKFEYVAGWMPLYNQFQDTFRENKLYSSCPTAIAQRGSSITQTKNLEFKLTVKF